MRLFIVFFVVVFSLAKNVLILNSYSVQFPWTKGEVEGILKNLKNKNLKIYIEFMDTKLFAPTPKYLDNFYKYLKLKYKNISFDIVITTDDNALNFVMNHKDFFKNSKVFFAGVNNLSVANRLDRSKFTGVFEKKEPIFNFNFLKESVKNLKRVYVVADNSNSAKAVMREYKNAFKNIKGVDFVYINDANLDKVIDKIKDYKNSGMLLLTPFSFKLGGKKVWYKDAIRLISSYYNAPIVIHTDILASLKDTNIIGGKVTDALSQGNSVSKQVLEYLNGKKIQEIPLIYEKANKFYLNVLNLKKFGIDVNKFKGENIVYVNKPFSIFEAYKGYIIATIGIIFSLIMFIVVLLVKNYRLIKYSQNIRELNKSFENEVKFKLKEVSQNYYENLKFKIESLNELLNFVFSHMKVLVYDMKNKNCKEALTIEKIISFFENSNEKRFFVKSQIQKIVDILKDVKFYEIEVKGEDFIANLDKILFTKFMVFLIKNHSKVIISDKKITIEYSDEVPSLDQIKLEADKLNLKIEKNKNKVSLYLN